MAATSLTTPSFDFNNLVMESIKMSLFFGRISYYSHLCKYLMISLLYLVIEKRKTPNCQVLHFCVFVSQEGSCF
jgi:hypothetical protein